MSLVTRSGTNKYHGSAYEYYRPTNTVANNWFNKQAEIAAGEPNIPPNIFATPSAARSGRPFRRTSSSTLFAYEGQRTAESQQVTQEVPTAAFRSGQLTYVAAGGSTESLDRRRTSPRWIPIVPPMASCPLGAGVNPAALAYYALLPAAEHFGAQ